MAFKPPFSHAPSKDSASGTSFTRHSPARPTEPGMSPGSGTRPQHAWGTVAANASGQARKQHSPPAPTSSQRKSKPKPMAGRQKDDSSASNASGRKPGQLMR